MWRSLAYKSSKKNLLHYSFCKNKPIETLKAPLKIAGFDLDGTLVSTKSGRPPFRRLAGGDWEFCSYNIPQKLQILEKNGFRIIIFSNQNQIKGAHDGKCAGIFKSVVDSMVPKLQLQTVEVVAATQKDFLRKGSDIGMWTYLLENIASDSFVDLSKCFYVGDMSSDEQFATSVGIQFHNSITYFE